MAWTAPSTFAPGAILTAAQLNTNVRDNSLAGGPIYATEALRDAAITSPFEGQRAYITGSTVAAATGLVTLVPTGIQTIYNGTAWVCVTPVAADTVTTGTTTSASFTPTLTSGGTNPSVTLSTGTTALVQISGAVQGSAAAVYNLAFAVSGASTIAASQAKSIGLVQTTAIIMGRSVTISGLTAGTNTFTLQYRGDSGTGSFSYRELIVQGIA